ncbi:MAG: Ribosomal RNA small subunit methyltransferase G [Phycisphaerales bacterium]|nr:Ribosomal RNA small subunit methyltransferase G [Phycisphaerales bacterium]
MADRSSAGNDGPMRPRRPPAAKSVRTTRPAPAKPVRTAERKPKGPPPPPREPLALPDLAALQPLPAPAWLVDEAADIGVSFDPGDAEKLGRYLAMLLAANDVLNLTAITDPEQAWRKHILDSLTLIQTLADLPERGRVIDVGTGGGLPGIPLAICMPHLAWTLLEATGKKVAFLRAVCGALGLSNASVVEARAETAGHDRGERVGSGGRKGGHREAYDAVVARAVGALATLAELTVPFVKVGGRVLLIKGERAGAELEEAAGALHLLKAVHETTVPTPTGRIVVLGKQSATPKIYPRRDGEPKRAPLGVPQPERDRRR